MPKQTEIDLQRQMGSQLINQMIGIRDRRRVVEQNWLSSRRAWMNSRFDMRYMSTESSSSPYNIPAGRRAAERTIVRGVSLLTPNVKWFEVTPTGDVPDDTVSNVDKFMWYVLRKKIRSRSNINLLMRSIVLYGLCHLKTSVQVRNGQVWPFQRVVDPFAFYIFPETAETIDQAELIFEDFLLSYEKYNARAQAGFVEELKRDDLVKPDWPYHLTERLAYQGITDPTQDVSVQLEKTGEALQNTGAGFVSLSELWLPRNDKLYQVYIVWNCKRGPKIVNFIQSEYDEPLYRSVIHRPLSGETYTNSMMDDITELDNIQNDQFNQFVDAVNWEQGFVAINEAAGGGGNRQDSWKMKPRAKWMMGDDPRNILQLLQPNVTSTNQLRAWQIELGLINSLAGTGTIAEGQPGRNMPRSGQAVNNLVNLSLADVQDIAELVEQEVLTPSLSDIYKVSSQFIPESQLMRIPGGRAFYGGGGIESTVLKRKDIIGDYEFEWVGSLQFQDENMRSQRMLIFLNLLPQLAPALLQQGYMPNYVELIKYVWRYSLGERGLSDVIVPIPQQQGPIIPGQPGAGAPSGGNGQQQTQQNGLAGLRYNLPQPTQGFVR